MGKIRQGILGGFSGKVGTVVGGSWKGINYMRGLATSITNPQTVPQLMQRQKFALIIGFLQPLAIFLRTGFKEYAKKMTGINAAMSYNMRNSITGVYPDYAIDYPNALVTRGSLPAAMNAAAAATVPARVDYTWTNNSTEIGAADTDQSLLVIYNPVKHQAVCDNEQAQRSAGTRNVAVPASFAGDVCHCYIGFISDDGYDLSSSRYAGQVTIL